MQIPFFCPKCGSGTFRVTADPKSPEDLYGAPCAQCGEPLTEEEIRRQARKIAEDRVGEAFKDLKL